MSPPSCAQHWTCIGRSLIEMRANFLQRSGTHATPRCTRSAARFVPRGSYVFHFQVNVDKSNITIIGENPGTAAESIGLARAAGRGARALPTSTDKSHLRSDDVLPDQRPCWH